MNAPERWPRHPMQADHNPFQGFWMGGYEGADHVNAEGLALDMVAASGHLARLEEDHRRAAQAGIRCVRESIGWRLSEDRHGVIDLRRALQVQASAQRHGLQVLWTLMHYGLPGDLSLHDDRLVARLARFAAHVARVLGPGERAAGHAAVFTPVNEISFLAWSAAQPGMFAPPNNTLPVAPADGAADGAGAAAPDVGYAVKRRLASAAIAAMQAIRAELPEARFLHVDPLVHVVAPRGRADLTERAQQECSWQWQAWDMLAGTLEPELGGAPALLDTVGVNHYHNSQWEAETGAPLHWHSRDPRRLRFSTLLAAVSQRYGRPMVVAETSHVGVGRAAWLHDMAAEVARACRQGLPVQGLCIYPLVDRPDWQHPASWHRSGLWHVDEQAATHGARALPRHPEPEALAALRHWARLAPPQPGQQSHAANPAAQPAQRRPLLLAFSHQRWDDMRHRGRHLLGRLAAPRGGWDLLFVEAAIEGDGPPRLDRISAGPHTTVWVPHIPATPLQPGLDQLPPADLLHGLLAQALADDGRSVHTVWLTSPTAWPLAQRVLHGLPASPRVVYDCGDDLAHGHGAPSALHRLEQALLRRADGVVCASASLAASRRALAGARLVVLANGVDGGRSLPAARRGHGWDAMEAAALVPRAAGPQLGFAGAVDERMDLGLLSALAQARPHWQFVIIGPVRNTDPQTLPRQSNIHWLGALPYRLLPALMAHWQVALLPFIDSAATRPALPLKVLEALGAGLPVVATPLPELRPWRDAGVHCAADADAFIAACDKALAEAPWAARARRKRAQARLRQRSWNAIAARLSLWLNARA